MGALAGDSSWTMEDDFRLRKAAETGTSFETLARGNVKFSKQFTTQELQERWLAILYDPVISAESSARMLEFEHADSAPVIKPDHLGNFEDNVIPVCNKRKPESIRKRFYALQKKTKRDHLPAVLPDADPCGPLQDNDPVGLLTYEADHNADITNLEVNHYYNGDNNCDDEESDGFGEILELLDAKGPESLPPIVDEHNSQNHDEHPTIQNIQNVNQGDAGMGNQMYGGDASNAVGNCTNSNLLNDLFDLTMDEDELPMMDADGNLIDMSYIDVLSSHWLDSPNNNTKHDNVPLDEVFCGNNKSQPEYYNQETKTFDGLLLTSLKPSLTSAFICTLNTEDPDIPSNDDVFLLNLVPSTSQEMQMDVFKPPLPPRLKQIIPKNNRYEQTKISSPIIGSQFRSEIKRDSSNEDQPQVSPAIISRNNLFPAKKIKSEQEMHRFGSVRIVSDNKKGSSDIFLNSGQLNSMTTVQQEMINVEIDSTEVNNSILVGRNLSLNEEAVSSQSNDHDDDDDGGDSDIPNFSDVEAMILDDDTSLDEQHLYLNRIGSSELLQTFKYENTETRKRIMRLEQAADAFVKREMKSQGAFAILQGRHMKYYIKKPEVLVGRATQEFNVDIDLGREGQNSKVSRRQAIIQMDHEGSFHMKNLSKYSIFINSMELTTNQSISLTSSCLIEIKGMAFLFETNEVRIKQYVISMRNKADMVEN